MPLGGCSVSCSDDVLEQGDTEISSGLFWCVNFWFWFGVSVLLLSLRMWVFSERAGERHPLDLNNWKRRFFKLEPLWMGGSNRRETEAYTSLEPGGRQWSHTWPLERTDNPSWLGHCPGQHSCSWSAGSLPCLIVQSWRRSRKRQGKWKKRASIMTWDKGK